MGFFKHFKRGAKWFMNKASRGVKYARNGVDKIQGVLHKGNQALDKMGIVGEAIRKIAKDKLNKSYEYKGYSINPAKAFEKAKRGVEHGERMVKRGERLMRGDEDEMRRSGEDLFKAIQSRRGVRAR